MVGLDGIDDDGILLVLPGQVCAQLHVAALDLVVNGLAQIMQQTGALAIATSTPSSAAIRPAIWATSMEWFSTFWP